ncbi:MAG: hypothetical protein ABSG96_02940 [Terracidiphilus sp.]|jgi:hypothetical protein
MNLNAGNPYFAAAEKATAANRITVARKKQLKKASGIDEKSRSVETFLLDQWMAPQHSQALGDVEYRTAPTGKVPDLG